MKKIDISQEGLKIIACLSMLLDHIGAVFCPEVGLRIVGRLAFPIYCFLLAEGAARTRNPKRYALRLAVGAVLAELPFDLLFFGGFTWEHQSVMVTLLLGFWAIMAMNKMNTFGKKLLVTVLAALAAELLGTDYGGAGIFVIALFAVTGEQPGRFWIRLLGHAMIWWLMGSYRVAGIPIQMFALLSMIPIACYSGRKVQNSRVVQWGFYLFYPVHMSILLILKVVFY